MCISHTYFVLVNHALVLGDIPVFSNIMRIFKISYSIVMIIDIIIMITIYRELKYAKAVESQVPCHCVYG